MKRSKKRSQLLTDTLSVEMALEEAKRKKRNAIIWLVIYTALILGCCILWKRSKLSAFSLVDCVALIGCVMVAIVVLGIAIMIFLSLQDRQLRDMDYWVSDRDLLFIDLFSYIGTAIAICLPCGIIWILVEHIEPLHAWLTTPIYSILRYRGVRFAGCILAVIPYLLLWMKLSKNKKRIPQYTQLLKNLQEQQELADLEEASSYDPTKSKSWEKMKAQRRAAEKRKASLSRSADGNTEENNEDEIRFL